MRPRQFRGPERGRHAPHAYALEHVSTVPAFDPHNKFVRCSGLCAAAKGGQTREHYDVHLIGRQFNLTFISHATYLSPDDAFIETR